MLVFKVRISTLKSVFLVFFICDEAREVLGVYNDEYCEFLSIKKILILLLNLVSCKGMRGIFISQIR